MRVVPLASSSKGNAYAVEANGTVVLIDCGVSFKCLRERLAARPEAAGIDLGAVAAVLVTHNHADHTQGLRVLLKRLGEVPLYANSLTAEAVAAQEGLPDEAFVCFENGQEFEVGGLGVTPFSVPHDAADPVGYLVRDGRTTYFHGTDLGTPLDCIGLKLAEADVATLESNHDPVMLRRSGRAPSLIQRIAGPRGHLSNDQACDLVRRFASPRLRGLDLGHLSCDCNAPHLAQAAMAETLRGMGRADVALRIDPP